MKLSLMLSKGKVSLIESEIRSKIFFTDLTYIYLLTYRNYILENQHVHVIIQKRGLNHLRHRYQQKHQS